MANAGRKRSGCEGSALLCTCRPREQASCRRQQQKHVVHTQPFATFTGMRVHMLACAHVADPLHLLPRHRVFTTRQLLSTITFTSDDKLDVLIRATAAFAQMRVRFACSGWSGQAACRATDGTRAFVATTRFSVALKSHIYAGCRNRELSSGRVPETGLLNGYLHGACEVPATRISRCASVQSPNSSNRVSRLI